VLKIQLSILGQLFFDLNRATDDSDTGANALERASHHFHHALQKIIGYSLHTSER
jgi:hypothetical protein